jgi:hypothetical protein
MTRALVLALAITVLFASPGFAQSPSAPPTAAAKPPAVARTDFSARAAGIDKMTAARTRPENAPAPRPAQNGQQGTGGRSFWKTPWPYVIIAGVAATVLIAAGDGDGLY